MRISELIKDLERIKEMKGDLLVSVYQRENNFDDDSGEYYISVELDIVGNTNTNLKNGQSEVVIVNEPYFFSNRLKKK